MVRKRAPSFSKKRLRNLPQYKDLSDEELDEILEEKKLNFYQDKELEERIDSKIEEFSSDYDIDDLKINDRLVLRSLIQAMITLEDYEGYFYGLRRPGNLSSDNVLEMDKINSMMSKLRGDISDMQNDLKITRRIRKGEEEETVLSEIERLKQKASEFYEQRMFYVWCPKCNMLLFTGWFLYPDEKMNKMTFVCNRPLDEEGNICGHKFNTTSKELLKNRGVNSSNIPESMK